jgi:hypothetical protein
MAQRLDEGMGTAAWLVAVVLALVIGAAFIAVPLANRLLAIQETVEANKASMMQRFEQNLGKEVQK